MVSTQRIEILVERIDETPWWKPWNSSSVVLRISKGDPWDPRGVTVTRYQLRPGQSHTVFIEQDID